MAPDGNDALGGRSHPRPRSRGARETSSTPGEDARRPLGVGPSSRLHDAPRRPGDRSAGTSATTLGLAIVLALLMTWTSSPLGGVEARSYDYSYGSGGARENERITCYTCMNVSNNEECNRYAIDRPCPEGRNYCLTLHVMDGLELDRSVLVNKRCAYLDECTGDSTGCTTSDGQTQCVSCCDQPYCNDYVPSNETSAMFHRSSARGTLVIGPETAGRTWRLAVVLVSALRASKCHLVS